MVASSLRTAHAGSKPKPLLQQIVLLSKCELAQRFKHLIEVDQRQNKSIGHQVEPGITPENTSVENTTSTRPAATLIMVDLPPDGLDQNNSARTAKGTRTRDPCGCTRSDRSEKLIGPI